MCLSSSHIVIGQLWQTEKDVSLVKAATRGAPRVTCKARSGLQDRGSLRNPHSRLTRKSQILHKLVRTRRCPNYIKRLLTMTRCMIQAIVGGSARESSALLNHLVHRLRILHSAILTYRAEYRVASNGCAARPCANKSPVQRFRCLSFQSWLSTFRPLSALASFMRRVPLTCTTMLLASCEFGIQPEETQVIKSDTRGAAQTFSVAPCALIPHSATPSKFDSPAEGESPALS